MQSHRYEFKPTDLIRVIAWPLAPVVLFATAMHLGARMGWLPAPRPALDVDRTVLVHQAEASRGTHDAEILFLGDSSCLMDVSARQLAAQLGRPALNLATFSYVSLEANARLLRNYATGNPDRLRVVVLLMHPEALRLASSSSWQTDALNHFLDGADHWRTGRASDLVTHVLGVSIFQGRVLARLLPRPLPGAYGRRYGFSTDLERFLTEQRGSAVDPESKPSKGNPEYRLAPSLKSASAGFRKAVPAGARLIVGITPVPEKFAGPGFVAQQRALLLEWSTWLKADAVLTNLPATFPEDRFAQKTHLNEAGQRFYTERLGETLAPLLR